MPCINFFYIGLHNGDVAIRRRGIPTLEVIWWWVCGLEWSGKGGAAHTHLSFIHTRGGGLFSVP